ncbi:MAG: AarF/UbiB family protein, partial [Acidocella sp.]|nr:AarF/UbiB family protein [Acidocella sp.]
GLQDAMPARPLAEVEATINDDLCGGKGLATVFASVQDRALAAASIGQVHRAVLRDAKPGEQPPDIAARRIPDQAAYPKQQGEQYGQAECRDSDGPEHSRVSPPGDGLRKRF